MSLADDLRGLRDRTLSELVATHDYYTDTQVAWHLIQDVSGFGVKFTIRNKVTGSVTSADQLRGKVRGYVAGQLVESTFQQFIATFENFFLDLLRLWLTAYPAGLGAKTVTFQTVLDAPDKEAVTAGVVDHEIYQLLYQRPAEWFAYLNGRAKLNCPSREQVEQFAEAKATRDVLVHSRGVANRTYLSKAGRLARSADGERIDITQQYHRATWNLLRVMVADIATAAVEKAS